MNKVDYKYFHWGPYLFKTKAPQHIIDRLKLAGIKNTISNNKNLAGNLNHQYAYPSDIREWFSKEISEIMTVYLVGSTEYHGTGPPKEVFPELELTGLWVNYMKPGDFNPPHYHSEDYSFVLFLEVPSEIEQEMNDFEGTAQKPGQLLFHYGQSARWPWATIRFEMIPKAGDMYIFPSLLTHMVAPFKSDVTRISVSGNFRMVNKKEVISKNKNWFA